MALQIWSEAWVPDLNANILRSQPWLFQSAVETAEQAVRDMTKAVQCRLLRVKEEEKLWAPSKQPWFLVSHLGPQPRGEPRWPGDGTFAGAIVQATVHELHRYRGVVTVRVQ